MEYGYLNYIGSGVYIPKEEASSISEEIYSESVKGGFHVQCRIICVQGITFNAFACRVVDWGFTGGEIYGPMALDETIDSIGQFFVSEDSEDFIKIKLMV